MPANPGVINNGVISKWLASKPSVTQMLTVDSDGNVGRQAIPSVATIAWGEITGTLSAQTDLQLALDGKASFVHGHAIGDVTNLSTTLTAIDIALAALDAAKLNTSAFTFANLGSKPTTLSGYGITDAQPVNANLTAISELTTQPYGRSLLTQLDASAARTTLGLGTLATQNGTISDYLLSATAASTYLPLTGGTLTGGLSGTSLTLSGIATINGGTQNAAGIQLGGSTVFGPYGLSNGWTFVQASAAQMRFSGGGIVIQSGKTFAWGNSFTDTGTTQLWEDASHIVAQRNGANAQTWRLYGTHTDSGNYRRLYFTSTTGGAFTIGVEGLGTGANGNALLINESMYVTSSSNVGTRGLAIYQNSSDVVAPLFSSFKSRGTYTSPVVVANGDLVAFWGARPYDGSSYPQDIAHMAFTVSGSVSTNNVPMSWAIRTGSAGSSYNTTMLAHHSGRVGVGDFGSIISTLTQPSGQFHVKSSAAGTVGAVIQLAGSATANALEVQNSAGSILTRIASNGDIYGAVFNGTTYGMSAHASGGFYCGPDAGLFFGNTTWPSSGIQSAIRFDSPYFSTVGAVALRSGTNPQILRIYNAFADTGNYDRGFIRWNSNVFEIGTERLGSYTTTRALSFVLQGQFAGGVQVSEYAGIGIRTNHPGGNRAVYLGNGNGSLAYYSCAIGWESSASTNFAQACGAFTISDIDGRTSICPGQGPVHANVQRTGLQTLSALTTDATSRPLAIPNLVGPGTHDAVPIATDHSCTIRGCVVALRDNNTETASFVIDACVQNSGGTVTLVSSSVTQTSNNGNVWSITVNANNTTKRWELLCTGEAGKNIRWSGVFLIAQVTY